jgi:hypothetical protein
MITEMAQVGKTDAHGRAASHDIATLGAALWALVAVLFGTARPGSARELAPLPFHRRITLDITWSGGWSSTEQYANFAFHDSTTGRDASGGLILKGSGYGLGVAVVGGIRIMRKFGVGAEVGYDEHYYELSSPLADALGIHYGRRNVLRLSLVAEYLPFSWDYAPRLGWFMQGSIGTNAHWDHIRAQGYAVQTANPFELTQLGVHAGFRFALEPPYSLAISAFGRIETGVGVGLRIGGGFQ